MTYRLKTFRVQLVAEPPQFPSGTRCRSAQDVERLARAIYGTLDADKEHFVLLVINNKNCVNGFKVISTGSLTASTRGMAGSVAPLRRCRGFRA